MRLVIFTLVCILSFGSSFASFTCRGSVFCPKGSCLFVLAPNDDGTCPSKLPSVSTYEEEDQNPCSKVILSYNLYI